MTYELLNYVVLFDVSSLLIMLIPPIVPTFTNNANDKSCENVASFPVVPTNTYKSSSPTLKPVVREPFPDEDKKDLILVASPPTTLQHHPYFREMNIDSVKLMRIAFVIVIVVYA